MEDEIEEEKKKRWGQTVSLNEYLGDFALFNGFRKRYRSRGGAPLTARPYSIEMAASCVLCPIMSCCSFEG